MFAFKMVLLVGSLGVTALLALSAVMNLWEAMQSGWTWRATGTVVEVLPPPEQDSERVPSNGPRVVVVFKDHAGQERRETYASFNSGGRTAFAGKQAGETVEFDVALDHDAPGATRAYRFADVGKVHVIFGGVLVVMGLLLAWL